MILFIFIFVSILFAKLILLLHNYFFMIIFIIFDFHSFLFLLIIFMLFCFLNFFIVIDFPWYAILHFVALLAFHYIYLLNFSMLMPIQIFYFIVSFSIIYHFYLIIREVCANYSLFIILFAYLCFKHSLTLFTKSYSFTLNF